MVFSTSHAEFHIKATKEVAGTLAATDYKDPPTITNIGEENNMEKNVVRRLTPLECSRLQGMPDDWCDLGDWTDEQGKVHKDADSPKYKALGNGVALPFWQELLNRIADQYAGVERPTLGSLFDGIGSFPLAWERRNGKGTALWASEIEPFPIAVTKKHFGDEDNGIDGDIDKYL